MAFNDTWLAEWTSSIRDKQDQVYYATVYSIGCTSYLLFLLGTSFLFTRAAVRSGNTLHMETATTLMHAPTSWFESTPSGRIMSRFSADLSVVDEHLSRFSDNLFQFTSALLALVVVVCMLVPPMIAVVAGYMCIYSLQVISVDRVNRSVKRSANNAMVSTSA
jgi:ABC-type multidrug transport system fused ATPase/permease subunit